MTLRICLAAALAFPIAAAAQSNDRPPPPPPSASAAVQAVETAFDAPMPVTSAEFGEPRFQGSLGPNDLVRDGGEYYDVFTFDAEAGQEVTVRMTSNSFDTYLFVRDQNGREWNNDDFGTTQVSQLTFTASEQGTYTIWASAFAAGTEGDSLVYVTTRQKNIISTVSGRLDRQDTQQIKGEYFDTLSIRAPRSGAFYIELMPLGFSGFVRATSPGGQVTSGSTANDGNETIRIGPFQPESGNWTVDITTMSPNEVGAYDLMVVQLDEQ